MAPFVKSVEVTVETADGMDGVGDDRRDEEDGGGFHVAGFFVCQVEVQISRKPFHVTYLGSWRILLKQNGQRSVLSIPSMVVAMRFMGARSQVGQESARGGMDTGHHRLMSPSRGRHVAMLGLR